MLAVGRSVSVIPRRPRCARHDARRGHKYAHSLPHVSGSRFFYARAFGLAGEHRGNTANDHPPTDRCGDRVDYLSQGQANSPVAASHTAVVAC